MELNFDVLCKNVFFFFVFYSHPSVIRLLKHVVVAFLQLCLGCKYGAVHLGSYRGQQHTEVQCEELPKSSSYFSLYTSLACSLYHILSLRVFLDKMPQAHQMSAENGLPLQHIQYFSTKDITVKCAEMNEIIISRAR